MSMKLPLLLVSLCLSAVYGQGSVQEQYKLQSQFRQDGLQESLSAETAIRENWKMGKTLSDPATVKVRVIYRGMMAKRMIQNLEQASTEDIEDHYIAYYEGQFGKVKSVRPTKVIHDLVHQELAIDMKLQVQSPWPLPTLADPSPPKFRMDSFFASEFQDQPLHLFPEDDLSLKERSFSHEITADIQHVQSVGNKPVSFTKDTDELFFSMDADIEEHKVFVKYQYFTKRKSIPSHRWESYLQDKKEIEQWVRYAITSPVWSIFAS